MKISVTSIDGEQTNQIELPRVFEGRIRPDIIKEAVHSAQSSRVQPKGAKPRAGMKTSAETPSKGSGRTRVRRIKGRGYSAAGIAAWAPFTKGGRAAHSLKSEEKRKEEINKKEKDLAIRAAISATKNIEMVSSRGHKINGIEELPIVVEDEFEEIKKTQKVKEVMEKLGIWEDVERVKNSRNIRSGKGKSRGRVYRQGVGPLLVVSEKDRGIFRGARNIPGVEVASVKELNAELLAPGGVSGRLTVWTETAIEEVDRRFTN